MSYDPEICIHKTDAMKLIQDLVSHGYQWWCGGAVEAQKVLAFSSRMDELYGVNLDRNRRARKAKDGEANTQLVMYPMDDSKTLRWWLLATNGSGLIHTREKLIRADSKTRLEWRGYEVVRLTFKNRPSPSWTWRMTEDEVKNWHARLDKAAGSDNPVWMEQAIHSLYKTPGVAGIRQQVGHLVVYAKAAWKKSGRGKPFPPLPLRLSYMRYKTKEKQLLSSMVRRVMRDRDSWFGTVKRNVKIAAK